MKRSPSRTARKWAQRGLFCVSLVLLGYWTYWTVEAGLFQASGDHELARFVSHLPGMRNGTAGGARTRASANEPIGKIEISRLGISAVISEGIDARTLLLGVGHIPNTPFPGEGGNCGLAAHRDSYFRGLKDAQVGDSIRVETADGTFRYRIDSVSVVDPGELDVLRRTPGPSLTLVTCYPFHYVGPAPKRFVVRAHGIGLRIPDTATG